MKFVGIASLFLIVLVLVGCGIVGGPLPANKYARPASTPIRWYAPATTFTPVPTITEPAQIPVSGISAAPTVSVSIATNCRYGPSADYAILLAFFPGDTANVIGKYTPTNYWVITTSNGYTCWLWGQNAIVTGDVNSIPDYPVPPLPATATMIPSDASTLVPASINSPAAPNTPQTAPAQTKSTPPPPPQPKQPKPPKPPKPHNQGPNQNTGGNGSILQIIPYS